jgi:phage-related protein
VQEWLTQARDAADTARDEVDTLIGETETRTISWADALQQGWGQVSDLMARDGESFVSALTELAREHINGAVTSTREDLERQLTGTVDEAIESAVGEVKSAIEQITQSFKQDTGLLGDIRALVAPLFEELDVTGSDAAASANDVHGVADSLGVQA